MSGLPAARLDDAEIARLTRLGDVVWNYLGERDPEKVGQWIAGASQELALARSPRPVAALARLRAWLAEPVLW